MSPNTPTFADLGAPPQIVKSLAARGIEHPFAIQTSVLPDALDGRDILGRAPTGSGKTLAFGIPVVTRMDKGSRRRPTALILSPTRELAEQIAEELRPLAGVMGHSVAAVYGGVGYQPQRKAIDKGASLVVACPGRLEDLVQMGAVHLDDVETVVVDEADRMSDMGFLPAVRRIVSLCSALQHTMLFSATLDGQVAKLTKDFQRDPVRHEVGSAEPDMTLASHFFWNVDRPDRTAEAARFIDRVGSTIVFTRTRHGADRLTKQFAKSGIDAAPIHGGRSQGQRTRALKSFSQGKVQALVATDVAARGIHVDDVAGVIHFDPPADASTYVHRSGRTARAGASGIVLSLVEPAQRRDATKMQKALGLPGGITPVDIAAVAAAERRDRPAKSGPVESAPARTAAGTSVPASTAPVEGAPVKAAAAKVGSAKVGSAKADPGKAGSGRSGPAAPVTDAELAGKVSYYSNRKGFGFIKVKGREDVFVHISGVSGEPTDILVKGNRVVFELEKGRKGPVAVNVRPLVPVG